MRRSASNPDFVGGRPVARAMTPTNGQVLAWNATAGRWEPATPEAGGGLADGVVTNAKVASNAAIAWSKISKSGAAASDVGAAAATHSHAISDTTGLQTALDGKAASSHTHAQSDITGLTTALAGKSDTGHTHTIANVTGLQAALDGKQAAGSYAAATHSHAISDVTGLQTALDGKAASAHTHAAADINTGTLDIARIPTGTSASTVALGNHTHSIYAPVRVRNYSTASQGPGFAADTYVTGSSLQIPTGGMVAGMRFVWQISGAKTGAGTATAVYNVRIGANQTTADTSRLAISGLTAQTAVTDAGVLTIVVVVRSVSATGVIAGACGWAASRGGAAGFGGGNHLVSSTFDNSNLAGQFIGISINGGISAAWTVHHVYAELVP